MLHLLFLLVLLTNATRPARVADTRSFADRLGKLYEKLERITVATTLPEDKLYEKIDRLNSLSPDKFELSDEAEELLTAMQMWAKLSPEQLDEVVKDLQRMREDTEDEKNERLSDQEYGDSEWNDEDLTDLPEGDYPNDKYWEMDNDVDNGVTSKPNLGVTPEAFTRIESRIKQTVISAVDPIAATNARPIILDDSSLSSSERKAQRNLALSNFATVMKESKCLTPQPRWLAVWQMAPAVNTLYIPSCVRLHRCAHDTGCCDKSNEMCAPIAGEYITKSFYLHKADASMNSARIQFFNHTRCGCVSRDTLQSTTRTRTIEKHYESRESARDLSSERQNDWRSPTEEPKLDNEDTSDPPPLLRSDSNSRCTCPTVFLASLPENGSCTCVCEWPDVVRRRDCLSLARGREHFGLRDRVCVANGDCTPPTCEYGAYDRSNGLCPLRRYRKSKYHSRARYQSEKTVVV